MAEHGVYTYDYPRPMVTVDAAVFTRQEGEIKVLLIRRKHEPFAGRWALPGGFIEMDEPLEDAAARELAEETGVTGVALKQIGAFGDPDRDPRGRSIGIAYYGVVDGKAHSPEGADDAEEARWWPAEHPPPLAFDHDLILGTAVRHLHEDNWHGGTARTI